MYFHRELIFGFGETFQYIHAIKNMILQFVVAFCWSFSLSKQTEHIGTRENPWKWKFHRQSSFKSEIHIKYFQSPTQSVPFYIWLCCLGYRNHWDLQCGALNLQTDSIHTAEPPDVSFLTWLNEVIRTLSWTWKLMLLITSVIRRSSNNL